MAKAQQAIQAVEHELVVVQAFLGYARGEVITEAQKVAELIDSAWQHHFVKRPKPAPADPSAS